MKSVIFGLVGIVVGVLWLAVWGGWPHFLVVIQGSIPPFLILVGAVAVAAGISSIKDNLEAKKEQEKLKEEKEEEKPAEPEKPQPQEEEVKTEETGEENKEQ